MRYGRLEPLRSPRRRLIVVWVAVALTLVSAGSAHEASPEDVLRAYLSALYARNSLAAYHLISLADRKLTSEADYLREHPSLSGAASEIATYLASEVRYEHLRTIVEGDGATITFRALVPDANDPAIARLVLGFDEARLAALPPEGRQRIRARLDQVQRAGRLPVVAGDNERWELVREDGVWRVFLDWAAMLPIRFTAEVKAGLPWAFRAAQPLVRATPGEVLRTVYQVRNLSDREITGKARHIVEPADAARYFEVITCFCLLEETLAPGEFRELPVVFRVADDVPTSVRQMSVRYEFYPAERFPSERGWSRPPKAPMMREPLPSSSSVEQHHSARSSPSEGNK